MLTALITGASRGIGAKTAELFAENGYFVIVNYNKSEDCAQKVVNSIRQKGFAAEKIHADVSQYDECVNMVEEVIKKYGHIDVLVNNAGVSAIKPLYDTNEGDFEYIMNSNFKGVFNMCKAATPFMVERKKGKIVNVSSVWGKVGSSCESVYCASKGAVDSFTKSLAKELGLSGINVNCVAPGFIDTEMNRQLDENTVNEIIEETPLARVGTPLDVANAILFLSGDKSDFITGQVLYVNGGWQI